MMPNSSPQRNFLRTTFDYSGFLLLYLNMKSVKNRNNHKWESSETNNIQVRLELHPETRTK